MKLRLETAGGLHQEDRMIKDKYRTFKRALKYSYQAADVELIQKWNQCLSAIPGIIAHEDELPPRPIGSARALINPNKLKQDYDDKILSIDSKYGWGPGDVFRWVGTDSYWLIYLEELTEDAYFRGDIRRCKYKIKFRDQEGNWCSTWAAIRGPVETQIDSIQKNQVRVDRPNLSLNILIPRNEKTLWAFNRYKEFIFDNRCWRVEAPDDISITNVIELAAEEYFKNKDTDDLELGMIDGLVIEPFDPTPRILSKIRGEAFIKPLTKWVYSLEEDNGEGTWSFTEGVPVKMIVAQGGQSVEIEWYKTSHGQFDLTWTNGDDITLTKTIVVESLW